MLKSTFWLLASSLATMAAGLLGALAAGPPGAVIGLLSGIVFTFVVISRGAGR